MPGYDENGPLGKRSIYRTRERFCVMKPPDGEEDKFDLGITGGDGNKKDTSE